MAQTAVCLTIKTDQMYFASEMNFADFLLCVSDIYCEVLKLTSFISKRETLENIDDQSQCSQNSQNDLV